MNTSKQHIPRPMNAFMVFSQTERKKIQKEHPEMHHSEMSKLLGQKWKSLSDEEKAPHKAEAERLRQNHLQKYPGYQYKPERKQKLKAPSGSDENLGPTSKKIKKEENRSFGQMTQNSWNLGGYPGPSFGNQMAPTGYPATYLMPNLPPAADQMTSPGSSEAKSSGGFDEGFFEKLGFPPGYPFGEASLQFDLNNFSKMNSS